VKCRHESSPRKRGVLTTKRVPPPPPSCWVTGTPLSEPMRLAEDLLAEVRSLGDSIVAGTVLLTAALTNLGGRPLVAQATQGDTLSHATVCSRAASTVQSGAHGQSYYHALADLTTCPTEGSTGLAGAWQKAPSDSIAIRILGEASPRLRDRDVLQAVLTAFRDPGRPQAVRLAALEALVGYYQPGMAVRYTEPSRPVRSGSAYVMLGRGDPPSVRNGQKPLSAGARQDILQALAAVGASDPDDRVSLIAGYVRDRLTSTPWPDNTRSPRE
jgi:hypothetical protein